MRLLLLLLISVAFLNGCKKNVEFPPEFRPNEFWARYTIKDDSGHIQTYDFRGEDTTRLENLSGLVVQLGYFTKTEIQDSIKQITAGLSEFFTGAPISVRLNANAPVTDPTTPEEWTAAELESILFPGKSFTFGDGPGEAQIRLEDYPASNWSCNSTISSNINGYLRVLEVSDYGAPEINIPYFGKKVKFSFSCTMTHSSGATWTITEGEAILLFRYFTF
jgi:hypothetical protein